MGTRGAPLRVTIDASVFLSVCLHEQDAVAKAFCELFERPGIHVLQPSLWPYEVINGLHSAQRRGRIGVAHCRRALSDLMALPLDCEQGLPLDTVDALFDLASERTLSVYDAAYVHFCVAKKSALWTLDASLRAAAQTTGVRTL